MVHNQSEAAQHFNIVIEVFDNQLLLFLHGYLVNVVTHKHGADSLVLLKLSLHDSHEEVYTFLEVLDELLLIVKNIENDLLDHLRVALAVNGSHVNKLGHVKDPVVINYP